MDAIAFYISNCKLPPVHSVGQERWRQGSEYGLTSLGSSLPFLLCLRKMALTQSNSSARERPSAECAMAVASMGPMESVSILWLMLTPGRGVMVLRMITCGSWCSYLKTGTHTDTHTEIQRHARIQTGTGTDTQTYKNNLRRNDAQHKSKTRNNSTQIIIHVYKQDNKHRRRDRQLGSSDDLSEDTFINALMCWLRKNAVGGHCIDL